MMTVLTVLLACGTPEATGPTLGRAQLQVSTTFLDFDGLPEHDGVAREFTLYNAGDVRLGVRDLSLALASDAFSWTIGTPSAGNEIPEDNRHFPHGDTGAPDTDDGFALVLEPGSRVTVTVTFAPKLADENYDSLVITTEDFPDDPYPAQSRVYGDADNASVQVWLHGPGRKNPGNLTVTPRTTSYGFVAPGQDEIRYVALDNVGEEPISVSSVSLADCADGFSISYAPSAGTVLEAGTSSVVEVHYAGSYDLASCRLVVDSDDPDSPSQSVDLVANTADVANNHAPTVAIVSPAPARVHSGKGPLEMKLSLFDADQRADMLTCVVRSAVQLTTELATCRADSAGVATVSVPTAALASGLETLLVVVTDGSGAQGRAALPVLVNTSMSAEDYDQDGYWEGSDPPDCDDRGSDAYPGAVELVNGLDDDCDEVEDNDTTAYDDDADGVTEAGGDCADWDAAIAAGKTEVLDALDNDCDGHVDEDTIASDDDGDGYAETDRDCDDTNPDINPSGVERCGNAADDDCNGLTEAQEHCESVGTEPQFVGGIAANVTAVEPGGTVDLDVLVYDPDGDVLTLNWAADAGELSATTGHPIVWTAPEFPGEARVSVVTKDDDGNEVWDVASLTIVEAGALSAGIPIE